MQYADKRDAEWLALSKKIGDGGDAIVAALRDLFTVYDVGMVKWIADLYDPAIGGWYYSNSARDNATITHGGVEYPLLPDIESTYDALVFLDATGMCGRGKTYADILPESIKRRVADYIYSLQDEDGYFYNPQWGKNITNSRQGRDLGSSIRILRNLGVTPRYTSPTATRSESGEAYDLSRAPERYRSTDAFLLYLGAMDIENRSYHSGSELLTQVPQIRAYGPMLGVDLVSLTVDLLNSKQHPDTGMWHRTLDYYGINGVHKLTQLYNGFSREFPNAEAAFESTLAIIFSDVPVGADVDVYNPWHVLGAIISNVRKYGDNGTARADSLVARARALAPEAIAKSKKKIEIFKKPDGSFSYLPSGSCPTSQGAPVAIPGSFEGDLNGNGIATFALVNSIYSALGLESDAVTVFTPSEGEYFVDLLKEAEKNI